jgi:hypothetical protein
MGSRSRLRQSQHAKARECVAFRNKSDCPVDANAHLCATLKPSAIESACRLASLHAAFHKRVIVLAKGEEHPRSWARFTTPHRLTSCQASSLVRQICAELHGPLQYTGKQCVGRASCTEKYLPRQTRPALPSLTFVLMQPQPFQSLESLHNPCRCHVLFNVRTGCVSTLCYTSHCEPQCSRLPSLHTARRQNSRASVATATDFSTCCGQDLLAIMTGADVASMTSSDQGCA